MHVCIFGGTREGRLLAEFFRDSQVKSDLYIATDYGEQFVKELSNVKVHQKRLNMEQMIELFTANKFDCIVDATHPFAENCVTECQGSGKIL